MLTLGGSRLEDSSWRAWQGGKGGRVADRSLIITLKNFEGGKALIFNNHFENSA